MVNAPKIFIDTDHGSWDSAGGNRAAVDSMFDLGMQNGFGKRTDRAPTRLSRGTWAVVNALASEAGQLAFRLQLGHAYQQTLRSRDIAEHLGGEVLHHLE
jgi:hypothetical protein